MKFFIPIFFLFIIGGCTTSGIVQTGPDSYMAREHSTLFTIDPGGGGAIANAITIATEHCTALGKHMVIQSTQTNPIGAGAQAKVNFVCVDENDRDYVRPRLRKEADVLIEQKSDISLDVKGKNDDKSTDVYSELLRLDDLRKKGIITEEEFEMQKSKILREQ